MNNSKKGPIRLLFIIDSLKFGGAQRQLVELIKGLQSKRYIIHLITFEETSEGYLDSIAQLNILAVVFPRSFRYDFRPIYEICRYIKENKIDLVHTYMNLASVFGVLASKLARRPIVCASIRDAKSSGLKEKLSSHMLSYLADIFVANSKAGFDSRFKRRRPHFRVVYNGMDFNRFVIDGLDKDAFKDSLGLSHYGRIVAMVATFISHKDHETFLEAIPEVIAQFPDTGFVLIGDGPRRKLLEDKVADLGLTKQALFLGFRQDIESIYAIIDINVLITNIQNHLEGISNAITEAMASGLPVIVSAGGGAEEVVQNGINGLIVAPKDPGATAKAIISLLKNKSKAKKLAQAGQKDVKQKFSLEQYISNYEQIYSELLQTA